MRNIILLTTPERRHILYGSISAMLEDPANPIQMGERNFQLLAKKGWPVKLAGYLVERLPLITTSDAKIRQNNIPMNTNSAPENFTAISLDQLMVFRSSPAINLYPVLQMHVQRAGTLEVSFSVPLEQLKYSLQCPTDYDAGQLLQHELYWAQLEMNQFGPYSFTAAPQINPAGESLIHFEINQFPAKSTEFGYLLIARDPGYAENVYLINTTRKDPDAYVGQLSRLEGNPSAVDLIDCLPILHVQRIRQRCRVLLAEYNQEFGGNFYRIQKQKALEFIRQLAQKE